MGNGQAGSRAVRRDRINIFQKYELRDWAICLDTPAPLIEEAVLAVGDEVEPVVRYLKERALA